jgi:hypothetical protein
MVAAGFCSISSAGALASLSALAYPFVYLGSTCIPSSGARGGMALLVEPEAAYEAAPGSSPCSRRAATVTTDGLNEPFASLIHTAQTTNPTQPTQNAPHDRPSSLLTTALAGQNMS